jgi:hypothetical protein
MREVQLIRNQPFTNVIFGDWCVEGKVALKSMEPPWIDNMPNVSCVPCGNYFCEVRDATPHMREATGLIKVYHLLNVPDRDFVEIHPANKVEQLLGCIALGKSADMIQKTLLFSRDAINWFMYDIMGLEPFKLIIKESL